MEDHLDGRTMRTIEVLHRAFEAALLAGEDMAEVAQGNNMTLTWERLGAAADVWDMHSLNSEDRALRELARLIRARNDPTTETEQRRMVDGLRTLATELPHLIQHRDSRGFLPLYIAVENNLPLECITILVEAHPAGTTDVYSNEFGDLQSAILVTRAIDTREMLTEHAIRHLHSSLEERGWEEVRSFFKCHCKMQDVVRRLVEEFPDFWRTFGHFNRHNATKLPLHYAVEKQAPVHILEIIVSEYPDALVAKGEAGKTPLHCAIGAISSGRGVAPDELRLLMTSESARIRDNAGRLPLHVCLGYASVRLELVKSMVELFPESTGMAGLRGMTPLHLVCRRRHRNVQVVRFLLDMYPRALILVDDAGQSPIHIACQYAESANLPVIKLLAEARPESIRDVDPRGFTVLHAHLAQNTYPSLSVVEFLVDQYPESLNIRDTLEGRTPLDIVSVKPRSANRDADLDVIRFLAPRCKELLESDGGTGTPLHSLCSQWEMWSQSPHSRARTMNIIRALSVSEKALQAKDRLGRTPLHLLSRAGVSVEVLQVIIEKCPTVAGAKDGNGGIPLHSAIEGWTTGANSDQAHKHVVRYLLEAYPLGVHAVDNDGMTPLMLACSRDMCLDLIYDLVLFDPISDHRLEWSQVPRLPSV